MLLVSAAVAATPKTFGFICFLLRLSILALSRLILQLVKLWTCNLLTLISVLSLKTFTSYNVTTMFFLIMHIQRVMTLTTVLSCGPASCDFNLKCARGELSQICTHVTRGDHEVYIDMFQGGPGHAVKFRV